MSKKNKVIYSDIQPNPKEAGIWVNPNSGNVKVEKDGKWVEDANSDSNSNTPEPPVYENGVYAVNADHKLIDYNAADSSCIGVALITDNQKIMIAKKNFIFTLYWGMALAGHDIPNIMSLNENSNAKLDFNGYGNTNKIIAAYSEFGV